MWQRQQQATKFYSVGETLPVFVLWLAQLLIHNHQLQIVLSTVDSNQSTKAYLQIRT
jgi:hypothetical protein